MGLTLIFISAVLIAILGITLCAANSRKFRRPAIAVTLIAVLLAGGCSNQSDSRTAQQDRDGKRLEVHFIDVGQGDSILVRNGDQAMLIDTGTNSNRIKLKNYLDSQGINCFEYIIGTNPLKDHIGGMGNIIENYDFSWMILPRIDGLNETYKELQLIMVAKYIKPIYAEPGQSYTLGDASFTILAPFSGSYNDLADYSIVVKLDYGETSFLLSSDAGQISEQEMLDSGFDLSADVLKLGRHGSCSSSTGKFLQVVDPDAAVISVAKDNPYLHPHMETMLKLKENNIPVYRTDEQGSIVAVSDGKNVTFNVAPGNYTWPEKTENTSEAAADADVLDAEQLQEKVLVNENSNKYHAAGCSFLDGKCVEITLKEALEAGYEACQLCKP